MDFWSRLIGGTGASPLRKNAALLQQGGAGNLGRLNSPEERLNAFKRVCNTLQQIWRSAATPSADLAASSHARNCLERLNNLLNDELRAPAPHPCLAYAAISRIYVTVTKFALASSDPAALRAAASFFNTLIDGEAEGIVDSKVFARALVDLVRNKASSMKDVEEGTLVELLFGAANRIRLQPEILSAWFNPNATEELKQAQAAAYESAGMSAEDAAIQAGKEDDFAGTVRKHDFPLFYLLIDYVHHEKRAGDFARTGLLYIIETATKSRDLEKWLIESDLATLMASGLGALYSQLPRKFAPSTRGELLPVVLALSDYKMPDDHDHLDVSSHLKAFLSYLLFWQDALDHCKSVEVNETLLDHFQVLFLQQLLYPSLLESSDVDGGGIAAVITYLYRILESVDHPDLIQRILSYLLASAPEPAPPKEASAKKRMSVSRRKSIDLLASFAPADDAMSPSLFNLVDLALMSVKSKNDQTVAATLKLVTIIIRKHHETAMSSLIRTIEVGTIHGSRSVGAFNAEVQNLVELATTITDDASIDASYENHLSDANNMLEAYLFTTKVDAPIGSKMLQPDDAIVKAMLDLLSTFFTNSVMTNLALTEAFSTLASSGSLRLDGWLLLDPTNYEYTSSAKGDLAEEKGQADERDSLNAYRLLELAYEEPSWSTANMPPLAKALQALIAQIARWREEIPDFDMFIAARKIALEDNETSETLAPGTPQNLPIRGRTTDLASQSTPRTPTKSMPLQNTSGIASQTPSQETPRGRRGRTLEGQQQPSTPQSSSHLSPSKLSTPPSTSQPQSRGRTDRQANRSRTKSRTRDRSLFREAMQTLLDKAPPLPVPKDGVGIGSTQRSGGVSVGARSEDLRRRLGMKITPGSSVTASTSTTKREEGANPTLSPDPKTSPPKHESTDDTDAAAEAEIEDSQLDIDSESEKEKPSATLGHILTNAIVLQEWILELAAIVQVRAAVWGECGFGR